MNELLDKANSLARATMVEALGIKLIQLEPGLVVATMPVDQRTIQPMGLLHGGASAALAETIGSFGSHFLVAESGGSAVGIELNVNHLASKKEGIVTGTARIIKQGKTLHVWNIDICNEVGELIATSRLTLMIRTVQK